MEKVTTYYESNTITKNDNNTNEICEGKEMNDKRGGKDVASVEEEEVSSIPSSEYVNDKDDLVGEFDVYTCSGDNYYDIFENEEEIITVYSIVWVNTNKTIWEGRVIKIPYSDFQRNPIIYNLYGLIQKRKIGF